MSCGTPAKRGGAGSRTLEATVERVCKTKKKTILLWDSLLCEEKNNKVPTLAISAKKC